MGQTEYLALMVPQKFVKVWKDLLQSKILLNDEVKVTPAKDRKASYGQEKRFVVPTSVKVLAKQISKSTDLEDSISKEESFLRSWVLSCTEKDPTLLETVEITSIPFAKPKQSLERANPLLCAFEKALGELPPEIFDHIGKLPLLESLPLSYCIYAPMLLLPVSSLSSQAWKSLFRFISENAKYDFFSSIATAMQVSHIAINAPVPLLNASSPPSSNPTRLPSDPNILRSPTNLQPLYGSFGPALPPFPTHHPISIDFSQAFWVSTIQNKITQVWAPRYTMFSSGNVTEKARLLRLPSVHRAILDSASSNPQGTSAVDLFAGIGYFAFSYARAGFSKVLCWDLNPWSLEGLRRGAAANKWTTCTIAADAAEYPAEVLDAATRLLLFAESNEHAVPRVKALRDRGLPPVSHVNCGMLPDAMSAVRTAVGIVDEEIGGWVHFHQVVGEGAAMEEEVQRTMGEVRRGLEEVRGGGEAVLEGVERVKSVAPRRWHVVLDIWIKPYAER